MFEDVLFYNVECIFKVFEMVKCVYIEKYLNEVNNYVFIKDEKLFGILRYIDEKDVL